MPLEIRELHIKAHITESNLQSPPADEAASLGSSPAPGHAYQAIVAACVEQVLQILKEKMER